MAPGLVELLAADIGVAIDEQTVPRHLDVVEIDQRVVLVEARRERVVEHRYRRGLVGLARQHANALGVHRQRAGKSEVFFTRLQRLQIGDQHLVGHDRGRSEHLGAADGDAGGILVDDARDEVLSLVAPVLGALGLRVDDHVGEEQVALGGIVDIVFQRLGALRPVLAKHLDAHALTDQRRGDVVRRAAHEAVMHPRPGLQRLAARHHFLIALRHLPGAVDAAVGAFGHEGHQFDIFRSGLKIVERGRRLHRVAERRMRGDILDERAVDVDRASVAQRGNVLCTCLCNRHVVLRSGGSRSQRSPVRRLARPVRPDP